MNGFDLCARGLHYACDFLFGTRQVSTMFCESEIENEVVENISKIEKILSSCPEAKLANPSLDTVGNLRINNTFNRCTVEKGYFTVMIAVTVTISYIYW